MRRLALIPLLVQALTPAVAGAQSSPFGPLPQPPPPPPPETEEPAENPAVQEDLSVGVLLAIGGGVLALFVGIGMYITRDARSQLTDDDRRALDRERLDGDVDEQRKLSEAQRKKARARSKAQKQARKKQRARR